MPEAQAANHAQQEQQQPTIQLSHNDMVGAMQRMLFELDAYLRQPVPLIDPTVVLGQLERLAQFNGTLPLPEERSRGNH
jgi:hypothetical protein